MFHDETMHARHGKWHKLSPGLKILVFVGWMAALAAFLAAIGLVVMLLWNRIMHGILGLPGLGFWSAVGLFVLSRILAGGMGMSFISRMRMRRAMRERMARYGESAGEERNRD